MTAKPNRSRSNSTTKRISERLQKRIGRHKYDMWFGNAALQVEGNRLEVATDSQFVARWIDTHFAGELRGVAQETLGQDADIDVRVAPDLFGRREGDLVDPVTEGPPPETRRSRSRRPAPGRGLGEFVVGECNRLAYNAAQRLADDPEGGLISPLFIHGECGVGKTHLLQGVCQRYIDAAGRGARARYMTGEQFTNEYVASLRHGSIEKFRARMRRLELLAIDDVHFLSNKVRTQSEFLHTLDAIDLTGARVVLASDEHPRLIKRFSQALISRFLSGMVVKVERPDRITRIELIERLAKARGLQINDAAVDIIAANCVASVRELEGAITKLAALKSLVGDGGNSPEIGLVLAEQLFKDHGWNPSTPVRIGTIIDLVCDRLAISRNDLMGSGRHRRVVLGRALVAWLGRKLTTLSYPEIAQALGRSYHSTVHTAAQRLQRQIERSEEIELGGDQPVSLRELTDQLRHEVRRETARGT